MTVFRLGLSTFQNCISGLWAIFILSSFHRPLLSLTLVLICWLGGAQEWCCESCAEVCMRAFKLPPDGALYRRAYALAWGWFVSFGLFEAGFAGRRASLFRLRCFLRVFLLSVCVGFSQRRGGRERWPLGSWCCGKMRSRNAGGILNVSGLISLSLVVRVGRP
jgi:hypothetical protein